MSLATAFTYPDDRNPALLCIDGLGTRDSRRTYATALRRVASIASGGNIEAAEEFPWHLLRYQDVRKVRREIATRYAASGANVKLSALRSVLEEAWRLEWMDHETFARATAFKNIPGFPELAGRHLVAEELRKLAASTARDLGAKGARDRAILALLAGTGIRACEVQRADRAHLDLADGVLKIRGKGHKRREVDVLDGTAAAVERWLEVRGKRQGPLFWPIDRWGRLRRGDRLSRQAVHGLCVARSAEAEIERTTPHDLRRTLATNLLFDGVDPLVVAGILGHAKVDTTRKYDRRGAKARRSALARVGGTFA